MWRFIGRNGAILGIFALFTTGLIALTFSLTKDTIASAKAEQLLKILNELVPESDHDNLLHTDCISIAADPLLGSKEQKVFRARQGDKHHAVIIETTAPDGYSGDINIVVAVDTQQTVLGARVIEHKETPGLGDKIDLRISDWILSFNGISYSTATDERWQVKKDGGQFDQFTGATITPRSVVNAIKNAVIYVGQNEEMLYDTPSNCGENNMSTEV